MKFSGRGGSESVFKWLRRNGGTDGGVGGVDMVRTVDKENLRDGKDLRDGKAVALRWKN